MPVTENRDLASNDLWHNSLERSIRRREQAAHARKEQNRKKTASLAVSAAVVAAPMWPSVASGGRVLSNADAAEGLKPREGRERVLLSFGDTSPTVASLQRKLRITADGIFGPQTEAAVRAFQKRTKLPVTGDVDVRTWLTLFPNDAIVATPSNDSSGEPGWAALSTQPPDAAPAATVPATVSIATDGGPLTQAPEGAAPRRGAKAPKAKTKVKAKAASLLPESADTPADPPAGDGVSAPAPPAGGPVNGMPAPAPGPVGGQTPPGVPGTPKPVAPPRPVAPIAPGGTFNEMINAMIREANRIDRARYSYRWGGGHNSRFAGPYDCSGAVSAVLHAAGLLKSPMVSGGFTRWGARGKGVVTIYANSSHVYMSIRGRFFGTSSANPGGGAGWFRGAPRRGFVVVHVPFERMKQSKRARKRAQAIKQRKRTQIRVDAAPTPKPRLVAHGDSVTGGAIAGTRPAAPAPPRAPAAPAQPPASAPAPAAQQVPAGATGQAPAAPAQPAPVIGNAPAGAVGTPPAPSGPAGPQGPPPSSGTAPSGSGSAPSVPAPAPAGAAPGAQAPSASPAPAASGTPGAPSSAGPAAGTTPPPAAPGGAAPSSGGPVSELGNQAVNGARDAVSDVTSELAPKPPTPPQPEEGSTAP